MFISQLRYSDRYSWEPDSLSSSFARKMTSDMKERNNQGSPQQQTDSHNHKHANISST